MNDMMVGTAARRTISLDTSQQDTLVYTTMDADVTFTDALFHDEDKPCTVPLPEGEGSGGTEKPQTGPPEGVEVGGETKLPLEEDMLVVPFRKRQDFWAWFGSLLFFVALSGAIFGIGHMRGWYAPSGHYHNISVTSQQRFLPEPYKPEPGVKGRDGVDASGRWYYWKLKPQDVTVYTELFAWCCYVLHQLFVWITIYLAQHFKNHDKSGTPRFGTNLAWFNWMALGVNVGFHLLHLLQTHITYDALAGNVSVSSSQCSVIMLIVYIFVIEYRDRGYMFGWPSQYDRGGCTDKIKLPYGPMYVVRKYHGYAFSWGAIYTFWYHPMENTWGHVIGFAHTYMILLQGSLTFTKWHLNKYWRFVLETWVAFHGTLVAIQTGGPSQNGTSLWPMFCFGFFFMVVVTQIFTLPFWRKIPKWVRAFPVTIYVAVVIYCYSWIPDKQGRYFTRMFEIVFIPALLLTAPLAVWLLLWLYLLVEGRCKKRNAKLEKELALGKSESNGIQEKTERTEPTLVSSILYFFGTMTVLMLCPVIGFLIQYSDFNSLGMSSLMPVLTLVYCIIVSVQLMFSKHMFSYSEPKTARANQVDADDKEKET